MKRILVVDDERAILETVRDLLEMEGYQVMTAAHGQEALARIKTTPPDLVLTDVMMPVLDGRSLCKELSNTPAYRSIPIVLMTAADKAISNGDCPYTALLPKPFDMDELLETIARLVFSSSS